MGSLFLVEVRLIKSADLACESQRSVHTVRTKLNK